MKPLAQVLLTVVLVAAGIAVYDALVVPRHEEGANATLRESAPEAPHAADDLPAFPLLQGTGDDLWRAGLERRLADLEARVTETPRRATPPDDASPDGGPPAAETDAEGGSASDEPWMDDAPGERDAEGRRRVTPEEVRRFRRLLESVEQQRAFEKTVQQVGAFVDQTGAQLTQDERAAVIKTSLQYMAKWKEMSKAPANDEPAKQERRESYQRLTEEYDRAIRDLVPPGEAAVLLEAVHKAREARAK